MTRLFVDFLTESRSAVVSICLWRKIRIMNVRINVLGPTSPNGRSRHFGAVCVPRCRQLRALAESADQFLERFGLRFCPVRLVTGAQDCHNWALDLG
jgi:hypothetical protein